MGGGGGVILPVYVRRWAAVSAMETVWLLVRQLLIRGHFTLDPSPQSPIPSHPFPASIENPVDASTRCQGQVGSLHCLFGLRGRHGTMLVSRHLCCLSLTSNATLVLAMRSNDQRWNWPSEVDWVYYVADEDLVGHTDQIGGKAVNNEQVRKHMADILHSYTLYVDDKISLQCLSGFDG
jgi:hypothetical protein